MSEEFTAKSTIGEVLKNPFGRDIVTLIAATAGIKYEILSSLPVRAMSLSALKKLAGKALDDGFIEMFCRKLNDYADCKPTPEPARITEKWWKQSVFYQIYPRSFCDASGDGVGDLRGIIAKLDYLRELGIDALWLSPIYQSPNDDNGYDISDYRAIMSEFGTMADFDELLAAVHERGMRLIMDLVVNHTSDEHEWFQKSRDPKSPCRDYYIWRDGKDGGAPNNWTSVFSGSAWQLDERSGQYYLHSFSKKQCDLNWANPKVRDEVFDMMNWWLEKGIDGFRLDVINMIGKPQGFPDGDGTAGELTGYIGCEHFFFDRKVHDYLREMNSRALAGRDVFTVGETPGVGMELSRLFAGEDREELNMVFSFEHLYLPDKPRVSAGGYRMGYLKECLLNWQENYGNGCWNSLFFDNHDNPRMLSRIDKQPEHREPLAKLMAVMLLTLKGTPFIYQGQELGMTNCEFDSLDEFRDVETINFYNEKKDKIPHAELMQTLVNMSRDHARTPMQWTSEPNAGFSAAQPWIKLNPNYKEINAGDESADPDSVLNFYKKAVALRHAHRALVYGSFDAVKPKDEQSFCYLRELDGEQLYIELNLTAAPLRRPKKVAGMTLLLSNYTAPAEKELRAFEANVWRVQ